jgi:enoyl-CoA hydratase/carnithine racemase
MTQKKSEEQPLLLREMSGSVCWLTLNRPQQRNPLSSKMIAAISAAVESAGDDPEVRAIVLAGSGPVFSAGHDLHEMSLREPAGGVGREQHLRNILQLCSEMMRAIMRCPKAVIACVQGTATAAGCQLVSACDLAIASEDVQFCTPGVNIGSFCTTPLVGIGRNMHRKHAMELALTGNMISADTAVRMGLINNAVPGENLKSEVEALAQQIASKSAQGIRSGKEAYYRQIDMPIDEAFDYATEAMIKSLISPDSDEGVGAFFEKREPRWENG